MHMSLLPVLLYVLLGCAVAAIGMIMFMLLVDSTGSRRVGAGAIFAGILILFLALRGLFVARAAMATHTVLYEIINPAHPWLEPWQAILGCSLACILGAYLLVHGIRQNRSSRNATGDVTRCI
jgi:hypothetical protein